MKYSKAVFISLLNPLTLLNTISWISGTNLYLGASSEASMDFVLFLKLLVLPFLVCGAVSLSLMFVSRTKMKKELSLVFLYLSSFSVFLILVFSWKALVSMQE